MSAVAPLVVAPDRSHGLFGVVGHVPLEHRAVLELATADDVASGLARVVAMIRHSSGAECVEWWAPGSDGGLELIAADGDGRGRCTDIPLERGGLLVVFGGWVDPRLSSSLAPLMRIIRRRSAEERLARTAMQLAQRNEALEDFAALVAHELKTPLHAALVADDPASSVEQALDLVDALLEAAQQEGRESRSASAAECLADAVQDLPAEVEITSDLWTTLPLPQEPVRIVLRNLLANAVAAGARHIHVSVEQSSNSWRLLVDDDGVGLGDVDGYSGGSGLGLSLCRRIAARLGGVLELAPRTSGGTRATLELCRVA